MGSGVLPLARTTRSSKPAKDVNEEVRYVCELSHHLLIAACDERIKPMEQLVPVSCTHYCASTSRLSKS